MRPSHLDTSFVCFGWNPTGRGYGMRITCLKCEGESGCYWDIPWTGFVHDPDPVLPSATAGAIVDHFRRDHDGLDPYASQASSNKTIKVRPMTPAEAYRILYNAEPSLGPITDRSYERFLVADQYLQEILTLIEDGWEVDRSRAWLAIRRPVGVPEVGPLTAYAVERIVDARMEARDKALINALRAQP